MILFIDSSYKRVEFYSISLDYKSHTIIFIPLSVANIIKIYCLSDKFLLSLLTSYLMLFSLTKNYLFTNSTLFTLSSWLYQVSDIVLLFLIFIILKVYYLGVKYDY
jgi:hypothetical protein